MDSVHPTLETASEYTRTNISYADTVRHIRNSETYRPIWKQGRQRLHSALQLMASRPECMSRYSMRYFCSVTAQEEGSLRTSLEVSTWELCAAVVTGMAPVAYSLSVQPQVLFRLRLHTHLRMYHVLLSCIHLLVSFFADDKAHLLV